MQIEAIPHQSMNHTSDNKSILIFMSSHKFWEGLYDTVDIGFLNNLYKYRICSYSTILMTSIVPRHISKSKYDELFAKQEKLKHALTSYGVEIEFLQVQGRTLISVFSAAKEIRSRISKYGQNFIWAKNYFNCFIGVFIKKKSPGTKLHFEMSGLVPEEEFLYSASNILSRIANFLVLRLLERINISNADSISVVSKRFKEYVINKYQVKSQKVAILPCYFDHDRFYPDEILREEFRKKLQIPTTQKVIFYSGMLQKWQKPDLLFTFIKNIQKLDVNREIRFMLLTYDLDKAHRFVTKYGLKDVIIQAANGEELNGLYNAADIGLAFRSADMVSFVSSPVKIPEYMATANRLIMLEYIGDFGLELQGRKYALIKKNTKDLLRTTIEEINSLEIPDALELEEIRQRYSIRCNLPVIDRILNEQHD